MKYKIISSFIKKNKSTYIIGLVFMFLASYIQTYAPKVIGQTIDILGKPHFKKADIFNNIAIIILISLSVFAFTYLWRNFVIGNARKFECSLREDLYRHFQKLPPQFYNKQKTGDLIVYGINDITAVRMAFGPATAMTVNGIVICASSIYFMLSSVDFKLTLLTLAPLPLAIFFMAVIGKKTQKSFKSVQKIFGEISDRVQENIYGIRVLKSYVQEDAEIEKFTVLNDKMAHSNIKLVKTSSLLSPLIEALFSISFFINLTIGGSMVLHSRMSLGNFVAFNTYLAMIMSSVVSMGRVVNIVQKGMASLQRIVDLLNVVPEIKDGVKALKRRVHGDIEFKNLTFYYPGAKEPALSNIELKIEKGCTVGIIGKTGSGKTTLANLLLKLYNSDPGQIYLGNIDINDYSIESIRNSFGFVPQDTFLFSASIRENIAFFKTSYTEDEVEDASRFSKIYESITGFPDGFDTVLGERGINLSGGQKQRIAIARAIIRDPSILILDDALSAVDTVTENHILRNFKGHRKAKTTIVISHRVSAVSEADKIIVLDQGSIVEQGTHNELLNKKGLYYDIFVQQSKQKEKSE